MFLMKRLRFKKLPNSLTVRLFAVVTFTIGLLFVSILKKDQISNVSDDKVSVHIIEVKIPPVWNDNPVKEEGFWQFEKFLNPNLTIGSPIPKEIPHSCGHLYVSVENDGQIKINSQISASLENTDILKRELEIIFQERTTNGVFAEQSNKIVKSVIIKAPPSIRYGDFLRLVGAVEESGAEPIVLQIDQYPFTAVQAKTF